ncbi:Methyltransferase domain-containing protein [Peptoniphilus asaccharolyticus DSM 20463]|uniref:Methyltransferase domain-containing protein n=1 Tax=Peptoniphilus asaccharolyticus DSM 20463 TaxID=573058 RepID=A0A1W1UM94_PEPAS|nr:class I SAM-dependent methyltransferase [Peptoniphilus asaccharolyticus]MBL7574894.1 class I SAM-dependent methyltransferase [Peptoniphilus asaccharolyticus]SMB82153.1 Methyltransferase domain-containing protein [Peptoniphilus asaccharolyticus DSM 20463]
MDNYRDFAAVYDELMWDFDYEKVYKFIKSTVEKNSKEFKKCLELGCGTGNLTEFIVEDFQVDAIDLSDEMLAVAANKIMNKNVHFYKQNMQNLMFEGNYDLVVSSCDSINYILEREELEKLFKWVYDHLNDGGMFIFDINSIYKFETMKETYVDESDGVFYIWENFYDEEERLNTYSVNFFKEEGELYERFYEEHVQRAYGTDYLIDMLKKIGYKVKVFDDYTEEDDLSESSRLTFVAGR